MPNPKENELIEKVIEFDQSIETNFRERKRESCAANGWDFVCFWWEANGDNTPRPFATSFIGSK